MNDEQLDEAFQELRTELSIEPSPEFAAKVRQQIETTPARPFWNVWTWTTVAATCGIALVAGALWLRSGRVAVRVEPFGSSLGPSPTTQTTEPSTAPSLAQSETPMLTPTAPTTRTTPALTTVRAAATETKLEVLVPPDQLNAIRQLVHAVRAGAVNGMPESAPLIDPETGELIKPKPIEIPLITVEPLPGTVEGRSGGSERK